MKRKPEPQASRLATLALIMFTGVFTPHALADITFTQTVDGWWTNTYAWEAQVEQIVCLRNADPVGTTKSVWGRTVQKNGSGVGTAIYCTTMTKASSGLTDRWNVNVPAGTITDSDFWDASVICFELTDCSQGTRRSYLSFSDPAGSLRCSIYPPGDLTPDPDRRYASIDPIDWDDQVIRDMGFHFAVYAYQTDFGLPIILNHVDEVGLSTFNFDETDAFGTGQPYDQNRMEILGIQLDPSWDLLGLKSDGLNFFEWQLFPGGGGVLITDQGQFQILQAQPVTQEWQELCPADFTGDGILDIFDVFAFLELFNAQNPEADFIGDGIFDIFDVFSFVELFSAGCP